MQVPLFQIDAFANRPFEGNPAAVVPLDAWLPDSILQAIAEENNLSETAFLVPVTIDSAASDPHYLLRWFTPTVEVELCGHATLASAWVVFERLAVGNSVDDGLQVRFETLSGQLTVRRTQDALTMDFPSLPPGPEVKLAPDQVVAMGASPEAVHRIREVHNASYQLWVFPDAASVAALRPDFAALRANVIATAPGDTSGAYDFVSRFFGPLSGVPEDPVTGSAHCTLAPYWASRLGRVSLRARQISARGGDVDCRLQGDRVELTGRCVLYLEGSISV